MFQHLKAIPFTLKLTRYRKEKLQHIVNGSIISMESISIKEAKSMISLSTKYKHSLLVSRIMSELAKHFTQDEVEWRLTGILHDFDYDSVENDMNRHGIVAASLLAGRVSEDVLHAIMSHDHRTDLEPVTLLDESLKFADALAVLCEDQSIKRVPENDEILMFLETESVRKPWVREIIVSYCSEYNLMLDSLLGNVQTLEQDGHCLGS